MLVLLLGLFVPLTAIAAVPMEERPMAVLRALDKITARVEEVSIPVEQPLKFGTLVITVHACRVTPPEETPESAAFLDVMEIKPGEAETTVFRGWMFASSPALSAMQHPVYDLWLTSCKNPMAAKPPVEQPPIVIQAPEKPAAEKPVKKKK